jgi:hypothetical protein
MGRMSVNRLLTIPLREKVTGCSRKLYSEELQNLYASPKYYFSNKIKKSQMGEARGMYRGEDRCIQVLVGKETTWKNWVEKLRSEDNIQNGSVQ